MKKRGLLILLVSICLVVVVAALPFMTACAPKAPRETVTVRLIGLKVGSFIHNMCHGLGEIVNKESDWLRIDVLEGMGSSAHLGIMQKEVERHTDTFFICNTVSNDDARAGRPPFEKPYVGGRIVATYANSHIGMCTTDPTIKTVADMKGKKAHFAARGATPGMVLTKMLEVAGIGDEVDISYGSFKAAGDALIDGLVDVAPASSAGFIGLAIAPSPWYMEAYLARKPTFVHFSEELLQKTKDAAGYSPGLLPYATMPAGAEFPDQAAYPIYLHEQSWWCDEAMDDEVVYEFVRLIVENLDKFSAYDRLGEGMRRNNVAWAPVSSEIFHPGALRYYQEHKIPVGLEAKGW